MGTGAQVCFGDPVQGKGGTAKGENWSPGANFGRRGGTTLPYPLI